jgi:CubicO group peptidase (beta-lactamase class C family)
MRSFADLDRSEYRPLEFPSGGGIGSARSIARAYDAFARGGAELGMSNGTVDELTRYPAPPRKGWHDEVLKVDTAYSLGFARPFDPFRFGSNGGSFGHPGAGGSFAFADPSREVSFAYVMNRMGFYLSDDPREKALRDAVYASLP